MMMSASQQGASGPGLGVDPGSVVLEVPSFVGRVVAALGLGRAVAAVSIPGRGWFGVPDALPDALSDDPPTFLERQLLAVDLDTCVCAYCLRTQEHMVDVLRALRLGHETARVSLLGSTAAADGGGGAPSEAAVDAAATALGGDVVRRVLAAAYDVDRRAGSGLPGACGRHCLHTQTCGDRGSS